MKTKAFLAAVGLLAASTGAAHAQIVSGGDFEDPSGSAWTSWFHLGGLTVTHNYTGDGPTGGSGGALRLEMTGDTTNGGIYQAVTLTGGTEYQVNGLVKEVFASPTSTWFEVHLGQMAPVDGNDISGTTRVAFVNTWVCPGYDGTFVDGCETANEGRFTVPGSGEQTWYLIIKTGVCCGGGPGEYVVDNMTITDLGAGEVFDEPPTPFFDDFNDGDGINNYGGGYPIFAGGDPGGGFLVQDDRMQIAFDDASGASGEPGDLGLRVFAATPIEGLNFTYYGVVVNLSPSGTLGRNLSIFDELSFDIRLGTPGATTNWIVRLEDLGANPDNAGFYQFKNLASVLGPTYTRVVIPVEDFVIAPDGGGILPDLEQIKTVVFAVADVNAATSNPDIVIDNLYIGPASASVDDWQLFR